MSLLHREYSIEYVKTLPLKHVLNFLKKADESKGKEKIWDMWIVLYGNMTKETFISFEDFYDRFIPKKVKSEGELSIQETYEHYKKVARGNGY